MGAAKSWTRKYRPRDLDTYVGNTVIKRKVASMFKNASVPQTMLLEGDRGCGKTTLSRIMAKNLVCKTPNEDNLACGECKHCEAMEKFIGGGESPKGLSVYEIDITNSNNVEKATALVEQMRQKPIGKGMKKVYILDEIQRATKEAQNAYLKISEEPGDYLTIILCTTNPEDLIDPFKSRFSSLKVKRPSINEIVERLTTICQEENVYYDTEALKMIAKNQNRIPRESISKLENIATGGQVTYGRVMEELQLVKASLYKSYLEVMGRDVFDAMQYIQDLYDKEGVEWGDFLGQLADYLLDVFNMKVGIRLDAYSSEEYTEIRSVLKSYSHSELARMLKLVQIANMNKENPKFALTMMTLEIGFPDLLEKPKPDEFDSEVKSQKEKALANYVAKTNESKAKKSEGVLKEELDTDPDDFFSSIPGVEVVAIPNMKGENED